MTQCMLMFRVRPIPSGKDCINIYIYSGIHYSCLCRQVADVSVANNGNSVQSNEQDMEQYIDHGGNELQPRQKLASTDAATSSARLEYNLFSMKTFRK